jgi:hypothetical protein
MSNSWVTLFGIIAGAGASFGGLIFVAMGNNRAWSEHPLRQLVALRTLSYFLLPCFFSIAVFIPPNDWHLPGFVFCGLWIAQIIAYRREALRNPELAQNSFDRQQMVSIPFGIYVFVETIVVIVADLLGVTIPPFESNLTWIAITMIAFYTVGWAEVWVFFVNPPPPLELPVEVTAALPDNQPVL